MAMPSITNGTKLNYVQVSFLNRFAFKDHGVTVNRGTGKANGEVTFGDVVALGKTHGISRKALVEVVSSASAEKLAEIKAANRQALREAAKARRAAKKKASKTAASTKATGKAKTAAKRKQADVEDEFEAKLDEAIAILNELIG